MIIVWRGWGIVVPLITIAAFFLCIGLAGVVPNGGMVAQRIGMGAGGFLAAGGIWLLARKIEEGQDERTLVDQASGQSFVIRKDAGSFFWVPTRYWSWVVSGLGVFLAVTGFNGS